MAYFIIGSMAQPLAEAFDISLDGCGRGLLYLLYFKPQGDT